MSSISKEPQFIIDSNERKSKAVLHGFFPNAVEQRLKVCDLVEIYTPEQVKETEYAGWGLEVKIDEDIHGFVQLVDEMTRCNYPQYQNYELHAVYISNTPDFTAYKVFVDVCMRANVMPHHVYYLNEPRVPEDMDIKDIPFHTSTLRNLIMKIRRGSYRKPLQQHKHASQHADWLTRIVAELPGVSESLALEIVEDVREYLQCLSEYYDQRAKTALKRIMVKLGYNQDGTPSLLASQTHDRLIVWGKEP
jgi:hypothetical protein